MFVKGGDPLLRRPFSFSRTYPEKGGFRNPLQGRRPWHLAYVPACPGARASLVGPLGNGFKLPVAGSNPLAFIAGGIGIAPLLELIARVISERRQKGAETLRLFYGARTAEELLPEDLLAIPGLHAHFATDDGSFGYKGRITNLFNGFIAEGAFRPLEIYSCGPLAMQYNVAKWALANDTFAQLSMESLMACGIGACLGCALPASTPEDPGAERFVHVCEDGPVFSRGSYQMEQNPGTANASPDLGVQLGPLSLKNPVMSASGTFGYGEEYLSFSICAVLERSS